jgi:2-oxoglutarate dehydrogenase E2 component (dihydrolipoamide succinyltransferase)
MADVTLPQLGETVTEGTITQWFKSVGDPVEIDEALYEVSTDTDDSEVPSPVSGILTEIRVPEGETVDVGAILAIVSDSADAAASPEPDAPRPAQEDAPSEPDTTTGQQPVEPPEPAAPAVAPEPDRAGAQGSSEASAAGSSSPLLSPVVRRLVNEHGVDPSDIDGTGPGGRITRRDVQAIVDRDRTAAPSAPASPSPAPTPTAAPPATPARPAPAPGERDTVEPFNNMRRRTAEHMVYSTSIAPHVLMTSEVDYERVEQVRRTHAEAFRAEEGIGLSYLPFVALAVVDAIREFPRINASMGDNALIIHHDVNLGIAVDLSHEGLIVPVLHAADDKRLRAVAREIAALAQRARSGDLSADDITGGTFTISNPGPFGTLFTGAIINQPQVAILSTDGVSRRPVVVTAEDGTEAIAIHSVGLLALSFDHRAFDGAYAAAFLGRVREIIQTREWDEELA